MAIMNVSLPDQMKQYVEDRVGEGDFNTTSEYIRDLIRQDQRRRAGDRLESLLLAGVESPSSEWTATTVAEIKQAVRDRIAAKSARE